MKNRLQSVLTTKEGKLTAIYCTAGFPQLQDTLTVIEGLDEADADIIEIGIPFSDPLADGEVIQQSGQQALENGMTLEILFQQLEKVRTITQKPLVLMGYYNTILQYGEERFVNQCKKVGIDGVILPDVPLEVYEQELEQLMKENDLSMIFLIAPETSNDRICKIDYLSSSFIYLVSHSGTTGISTITSFNNSYFQRVASLALQHPILVGFGIHNKDSFSKATHYAKGGIVGSAFIQHIQQNGISKQVIADFVNDLK